MFQSIAMVSLVVFSVPPMIALTGTRAQHAYQPRNQPYFRGGPIVWANKLYEFASCCVSLVDRAETHPPFSFRRLRMVESL